MRIFRVHTTRLARTGLGSDPGRVCSGRGRGGRAGGCPQPSERYGSQSVRSTVAGCGGWSCWQVRLPRLWFSRRRAQTANAACRSCATRARRTDGAACANGNEPERGRLPERRHLDPVDLHRLARPEARAGGRARRLRRRSRVRRLPSHGTALGGPHGAGEHRGVRVEPLAQRGRARRSHAQRRLDRPAAQLVREDPPRERRCRLRPREAPPGRRRGCRRNGRGSCRSPPGRRACAVDRRSLREHGVLELRREGEVAIARQPVQGGDVAREQPGRAEQAERPGRQASRRRRATGRDPSPRARARRRASGRASTATRRRPSACRGRCPAGLKAAQPHDQMLARCSSAATCLAASASHLTTSSHFESGCSPSRPPAFGVELNVSIIPEPVRRHADLDQVLHARAHRLAQPAAACHRALLRDLRPREVDLRDDVGDLRRGLPPRVGVGVVRVRAVREQEERPRAPLGEPLQVREHVRAVLRRRRSPRRRQLRSEQLVLGDQRVVAAGGRDGGVEELVGAGLDHPGRPASTAFRRGCSDRGRSRRSARPWPAAAAAR